MKILSYNILEGGTGRIDPLAEVIRQAAPDLAVLPETWDDENLRKLADRLGMTEFQARVARNPHGCVGLLSKLTIIEAVNHGPLDDRLWRAAFHAVLRGPDAVFAVIGLHLHAGATDVDEEHRLAELPAILDIARSLEQYPLLIAGDFNSSHPDELIDVDSLAKRTRDEMRANRDGPPRQVVARMLAEGFVDTHALGREPSRFEKTFEIPRHPGLRYDYIFASPSMLPAVIRNHAIDAPLGRYASDHRPVLAEMDMKRLGKVSG